MKTEFEFIEKLRRRADTAKIGDDCAVIPKDSKTDLVITTDLLVEDIDFRLDWTKPEFLGHKALAVSLSDVAAMGAKPVWAMLSIGVPASVWKTDFVERFYDGWFRLAKKFNVELIGGDVSKTPDKIVVDSIAAGEVKKGKAVLRSGAKPRDLIYVSGSLGGAAFGLKLLESGDRFDENSKNFIQKLLLRQLKPEPLIAIGKIVGANNLATAMIDLSDGLSSDLAHLCRQSKVGARIFADKIPVDANIKKFCEKAESENSSLKASGNISISGQTRLRQFSGILDYALSGGEDFDLLFTVSPEKKNQTEKRLEKYDVSRIGQITANAGIIELAGENESTVLQPKGFRHF